MVARKHASVFLAGNARKETKRCTSEGALDDFEITDVAKEVRVSWGVWIPLLAGSISLTIGLTAIGGSGC